MPVLRRVVFYLFFLAYLIVCPLTILYAFGVIFTPEAANGVLRTGLISVSTIPPAARIYIEQRRFTQTTPAILKDLRPGEYHIRLVNDGCQPWSGLVRVKAGLATALEDVFLPPTTWDVHEHAPEPVSELLAVPETSRFLVRQGRRLGELLVYHEKDQRLEPLVSQGSPWAKARLQSSWLVSGSEAALFRVRMPAGERFVWIAVGDRHHRPDDLTDLFVHDPTEVLWDADHPEILWNIHPDGVDRINRATRSVTPLVVERALGYGMFRGRLSVLTPQYAWIELTRDGPEPQVRDAELFRDPALLDLQGPIRWQIVNEQLMFLLDRRGVLWNRTPLARLAERDVQDVRVHPSGDFLLIRQRHRLGIVDLVRLQDEKADGPIIRWMTEHDAPIRDAFWVADGTYVLFRDDRRVLLVHLWRTSEGEAVPLVEIKRGTEVAWGKAQGRVYFLDAQTSRLSSIAVMPQRWPTPPMHEGPSSSETLSP